MSQGCFIVFEGIDGSGKGTQIEKLSENLAEKYIVVETKEPTDTRPIGGLIRDVLWQKKEVKKIPEEAFALLFAADRLDHLKNKIIPALRNGSVVLSDRYVYSSYAYQSKGMKKELGLDWLYSINKYAIEPDIVIFLDISPELGQKRLLEGQKRLQDHKFFSTIPQQQKIRSTYYQIFNLNKTTLTQYDFNNRKKRKKDDFKITNLNNTKILCIDGSKSIDDISKIINDSVCKYLIEKMVQRIDNNKPKKTQPLTIFS